MKYGGNPIHGGSYHFKVSLCSILLFFRMFRFNFHSGCVRDLRVFRKNLVGIEDEKGSLPNRNLSLCQEPDKRSFLKGNLGTDESLQPRFLHLNVVVALWKFHVNPRLVTPFVVMVAQLVDFGKGSVVRVF